MKYVDRSQVDFSEWLSRKDVSIAQLQLDDFYALSREERSKRRFEFQTRALQHLKPVLSRLFEERCAYCESQVGLVDYGDIEQFRPKVNARNSRRDKSSFEHYTWLAYDPDNLLFACRVCNMNKGSLFPVVETRVDPEARVPAGIIHEFEKADLLDPCLDVATPYLKFELNGEVKPRDGSHKGATTIKVLGLNRESLVRARRLAVQQMVQALAIDELANLLTIKPSWSNAPDKVEISEADVQREAFVFASAPHPGATSKCILDFLEQEFDLAGPLPEMVNTITGDPGLRDQILERYSETLSRSTDTESKVNQTSEAPNQDLASQDAKAQNAGAQAPSDEERLLNSPLLNQPLTKVEIANFKALKQIEFTLRIEDQSRKKDAANGRALTPCCVILGENATGKSSVLEAIALALLGADNIAKLDRNLGEIGFDPQDYIHRRDLTDPNSVAEQGLAVELEFNGGRSESDIGGALTITAMPDDKVIQGNKGRSKIVLAYGARRFFKRGKTRWNRAPIHRVKSLFDPMATIPDPLSWLISSARGENWNALVRALKPILMLSGEDDILVRGKELYVVIDGIQTRFRDMSIGYKSIIAMSVDIMRELLNHYDNLEDASAIVLIDEIENHLHPRWKIKIISALRDSLPNVQFIVTTHDPLCLRGFSNGEIYVLKRVFDERTKLFSGAPHISPLILRPGMDADEILTSAGFGLSSTFVDETTEDSIEEYAKLLLRQNEITLENLPADDEISNRISELRVKLASEVTGFGGSVSEEAAISSADFEDLDATLEFPANFEAIMKQTFDEGSS